jgi:hypothetical protein
MNQLVKFGFRPKNIRNAAIYLLTVDAIPTRGKSLPDIEKQIQDAAISRFKNFYQKPTVNPAEIDDAYLQGSIVWKGLSCTFNPVALSGTLGVNADLDCSQTLDGSIDVDFHIFA